MEGLIYFAAMTLRPWIRVVLRSLAGLLLVLALGAGGVWWYFHPSYERTNGIVYGHRGDQELALDVLRPARANGRGVLVLVSGRWKSKSPGSFGAELTAPFLRRGYTVFPVYHVSQPQATVMEIIEDMHRAVRVVRYHAAEYGVDPEHLGVTGGSAGGHLSLMLATRGGPGPAEAADPVDRASSAVQAVAIFFPVTDLLNWGVPGKTWATAVHQEFSARVWSAVHNLEVWRGSGAIFPDLFCHEQLPPVLIHHGDADTLTPLEQSEWFAAKAAEVGRPVKLVVHHKGQHGWFTWCSICASLCVGLTTLRDGGLVVTRCRWKTSFPLRIRLAAFAGVTHRRLATADFPSQWLSEGRGARKRYGGVGVIIADGRHWFSTQRFLQGKTNLP